MTKQARLREEKRVARHERLRKDVVGRPDRPRLCVHRSLNNISAQVIDDSQGKVILGVSTLRKDVKARIKSGGNVEAATILGEVVAQEAKKKGISQVSFDRGGNIYHGRVKAFAEAARKNGLEF